MFIYFPPWSSYSKIRRAEVHPTENWSFVNGSSIHEKNKNN